MKRTTWERASERHSDDWTFKHHIARYQFALQHISGRRVLDVACGTGYGAQIVASRCNAVVAVDLSWQGIHSAVQQHACAAVSFVQGDGTSLPFGDGTFGAAISLETVEHINHDTQFIAELGRVLRANGMLYLSTPNRAQIGVRNPYHIREYLLDELLQLLAPHFSVQKIYGQFAHPRLTVLGRLGLPLGSINRLLTEHVSAFAPVKHRLAGWCPELFQGYKPLQEGEIHFSESAPELGSHFFVCCLKG